MDASFRCQLVSSHLVSNIILDKQDHRRYMMEAIEKTFGLVRERNVRFREKLFYQLCWSQILEIAGTNFQNEQIVSQSYTILEGFAPELSKRSTEYGFYCDRLLHGLHSQMLSGRTIHSSSLKCLDTYLKEAQWENISGMFDHINECCFCLISQSKSVYNLGAIALWRLILLRGVSSKSRYPSHMNLTLVLAQIQIISATGDESVREASRALLQDLVDSYKTCTQDDAACNAVSDIGSFVSQDIFDLNTVEEFQDQENPEIEYFLRGSIAQKKHVAETKSHAVKLKERLLDTFESFSDVFNNREMCNIERSIREGVDLSLESNLSILECIFRRFLQITYGELTAMAQESMIMKQNKLQDVENCTSVKNSFASKSFQQMIDTYKGDVIEEADDIEAKFISYAVPHFKKVLKSM